VQYFSAKKIIFREGELGNMAYVVREGSVAIVKQGDQGYVTLNTIGPGGMFGEMALIDSGRRLASAIAVTDTQCSVIRADTFEQRVAELPPTTRAIFEMMVRYVRDTMPWEERKKNPLLAEPSDADLRIQPIMAKLGTTIPADFSGVVLQALYKVVTTYVRQRLPQG
jgi:CRP/FNR family transcriptional regulator, cyclic AMP receptor protein